MLLTHLSRQVLIHEVLHEVIHYSGFDFLIKAVPDLRELSGNDPDNFFIYLMVKHCNTQHNAVCRQQSD